MKEQRSEELRLYQFGNSLRGGDQTMSDETYAGWPNYETWCVNLWITSEEHSENHVTLLSNQATNVYQLARELKTFVEELVSVFEVSGLQADLLGHALDRVDWRCLAEHYWEGFRGNRCR